MMARVPSENGALLGNDVARDAGGYPLEKHPCE